MSSWSGAEQQDGHVQSSRMVMCSAAGWSCAAQQDGHVQRSRMVMCRAAQDGHVQSSAGWSGAEERRMVS